MPRTPWVLPLYLCLAACGGTGKGASEPPADPFREDRPARASETEAEPPGDPAAPDITYSEGAVPEDEFEGDSSYDDAETGESVEIEIDETEDPFDSGSESEDPE